jgi:uncharacterized cupredoxin-like copper-binding protein
MTIRFLPFLFCMVALDAAAERAIRVTMSDTMRYDPAAITVSRGEQVRFIGTNTGKLVHEIVIGTRKDLEQHAEHMKAHPHMEHHEKNMLRVAPGKTGELAWRFDRAGTFYYGCLEPGHFEAGMVGTITVR